jgi:Mn2+/Fe2+ NRAMP family transporter
MVVMMLMTANQEIMGKFRIHGTLQFIGWAATVVRSSVTMWSRSSPRRI